jgi:hypothetical protein
MTDWQIFHFTNLRNCFKKGQQGMPVVLDVAALLGVINAKSASKATSVAPTIFVFRAVRTCLLYTLH